MNPRQPIRHILVPHDFQENSDAALDYALGLARSLGARVTVLHAYDIPAMTSSEVLVLTTDWMKQIQATAGDELGKIVARARATGLSIERELRQGTAWREVEAFARTGEVDLIIVGSHGRHGVPRALLGSVAEKIVRTAPCPVLVVRGPVHG